ncbi:MAG: hypothetical protein HKL88_05130 [Bacteroidia bacterium]|jgi:hypothetical protein|nr:hypothetical protein [Bacteroidia bacterium]
MDALLKQKWQELLQKMELQFGEGIELEGILLLIGAQELGKGYRKLSKDEKQDVLHIAFCTLLEPLGYYAFRGTDGDGWPHWDSAMALPPMKPGEQKEMIMKAILNYFKGQFAE